MFKKVIIKNIFILFVLSCLGLGSVFGQFDRRHLDKLNRALHIINSAYIDELDNAEIVSNAIKGILRELDPHSSYLSGEELRRANEPLEGGFDGIGIQFQIISDTILVNGLVPGGPSEKVGVLPGDKIVTINGETSVGSQIDNQFVLERLRGVRGTQVKIGVVRRNVREVLEFTITRDRIPIFSIDASFMVAPDIGYIKLSRFSRTTMDEFFKAVEELTALGMEHMILDLNFNSGGFLNVAMDLGDQFLQVGQLIVYTEGRSVPSQRRYSSGLGVFQKGKLVVLVNEGSASASEILAGAVQDWDRGLIVGRRTFGKGLVQQQFNLPDGSQIRLTTSQYHTPTGRTIQRPFQEGNQKYREDLRLRLERGELFSRDSIYLPDSLMFYTKINNRLVFGGGGIIPDFFVPIDTARISNFHALLNRTGTLNTFSVQHTNENRDVLKGRFPSVEAFIDGFEVSDGLIEMLVAFAKEREIYVDESKQDFDLNFLKLQLKGLIARNLFDFGAYIKVMAPIDDSLQKAIELIKGSSFERMNIRF